MSASDVVLRKIIRQARTIKALRQEVRRVRLSRDEWKRKHAVRGRENTALRRQLKRQHARRKPPTPGVFLSEHDLARILEMPPR